MAWETIQPRKPRPDPLLSLIAEDDADTSAYFHALGRFVHMYTGVEREMFNVVHYFGKLDHRVAKALFHNLRMDNAINYLNRSIEARRLRGANIIELRLILQHLGHIQKVRNDILHLGASQEGQKGSFIVSNKLRAHHRRAIRRFRITVNELNRLHWDLVEIWIRLVRLEERAWARVVRGTAKDSGERARAHMIRAFNYYYPRSQQPAWRYKPPRQAAYRSKGAPLPPPRYLRRASVT